MSMYAERTSLFGDAPTRRTNLFVNQPKAAVSPYEKAPSVGLSQSTMLSLESQNNEEAELILKKVGMLKTLGVQMGDQIRSSSKTMDLINSRFENVSTNVKLTYNKMIIMSQNANISWKTWFLFFFAVFLFFFWVWIF